MDITWHIETRKLSDLKEYYKNPRSISYNQEKHLTESLKRFGLIDKPIINLDNTIIGGHQRKRVLKKMGIKEVEVNVPSRMLAPEEIEELNIRLNKNQGEFDWDILANQFDGDLLLIYGFEGEDLLGKIDNDEDKKKQSKNKKITSCPACGHEF